MFFSPKGIVGTLIFEFPHRQVIRILIISFPEHEKKRRSRSSGPAASLMIKLAKNVEREKSRGGVPNCIPSPVGDLFNL